MRSKALGLLALSALLLVTALPLTSFADDGRRVLAQGSHVIVHRPHYWGGWGDPFWGGYYSPNYYVPDNRGKIKIRGFSELDQVYVNGSYAGSVDDLDSFRLDPGRYTIVIKSGNEDLIKRNVYVVTGKTIRITRGGAE